MEIEIWPVLFMYEHYFENIDIVGKRLLICGVKNTREETLYKRVIQNDGTVTIVEPWKPNVEYVKPVYPQATVLPMTVDEYARTNPKPWPDLVMWLQGPEHASKPDSLWALNLFRTNGAQVIAEMPHGRHVQGPDGGNPHEEHQSYFYPADFDPQDWRIVLSLDNEPKEALEARGDLNAVRHMLVVSR